MTALRRIARWLSGLRFTVATITVTHETPLARRTEPELRPVLSKPQREAVALLVWAVATAERERAPPRGIHEVLTNDSKAHVDSLTRITAIRQKGEPECMNQPCKELPPCHAPEHRAPSLS